jgi:Phosphoenolpyruvate phosphomutase
MPEHIPQPQTAEIVIDQLPFSRVASSHGRPDGGRSIKESNAALAEALRSLDCFVSLDIEDGYADDPAEVADYVAGVPPRIASPRSRNSTLRTLPVTVIGNSSTTST